MNKDRFSNRFHFVHESGDELYPVRMESKLTKRFDFRICAPDLDKAFSQEADEEEMVRMVLEQGYRVRMTTIGGSGRNGLYSPTGHSIREVAT